MGGRSRGHCLIVAGLGQAAGLLVFGVVLIVVGGGAGAYLAAER
ncbi:hypothetical protein [Dactylosporangium sp. NPDC050588]